MSHPLRCRCGTLQGHIVPTVGATRAVCYCKDCQAYARFLGTPGVVDADGGTEVVALVPGRLQFTAGLEALACLSLSERGIFRWYASCCGTPVANTPRDPKLPYAGVIRSCLESGSPSVEDSFGKRRMAVNTGSALHPVASAPIANVFGGIALVSSLLGARLSGAYKTNPFFVPGTRTPIRPPRVLSAAERERAYRADA
jgi:hypothetical protein